MVLKTPQELLRLPIRDVLRYGVLPKPEIITFDSRCPNILSQLALESLPGYPQAQYQRIDHHDRPHNLPTDEIPARLLVFYQEVLGDKDLSISRGLENIGVARYGKGPHGLFVAFGSFFESHGEGCAHFDADRGWGMTQRPRAFTNVKRFPILRS